MKYLLITSAFFVLFLSACAQSDSPPINIDDLDLHYPDSSGRSIGTINGAWLSISKAEKRGISMKENWVEQMCDCYASNVDFRLLIKMTDIMVRTKEKPKGKEDEYFRTNLNAYYNNQQNYTYCQKMGEGARNFKVIEPIKNPDNIMDELKEDFERECSGFVKASNIYKDLLVKHNINLKNKEREESAKNGNLDVDAIDATYVDATGRRPEHIRNVNTMGVKGVPPKEGYVHDLCDCYASNVDLKAMVKHLRLVVSIDDSNARKLANDKEVMAKTQAFVKHQKNYNDCKELYSYPLYYGVKDIEPDANMPVEMKDIFESKCSGVLQLVTMIEDLTKELEGQLRKEFEAKHGKN